MKKVLQPSRNVSTREKDTVGIKTSTPVNSISEVNNKHLRSDPNVSAISISGSKNKVNQVNAEKENQPSDFEGINSPLLELKGLILQNHLQNEEQKKGLQDINMQISELREQLGKEKENVRAVMDTLKEIALIEKQESMEKECQQLSSSIDEELLTRLEQLTTVVNHEKNKFELKNISFVHDDKFKELLSECSSSMKAFKEGKDLKSIKKLGLFLPELEESLQQCDETNQRCAEIIEKIKRMTTHYSALKLINSRTLN